MFALRAACSVVLVLFVSAAAQAQTAYVTDNLRLGLHREADTSDRPFRVLDSGQEMNIISRNANYALARLPDGEQGYVKTAYLVDDKPAKLIVAETAAERDALAAELATVKGSYAGSAARIEELVSQVGTLNVTLAEQRERVTVLEKENTEFRDSLSFYRLSLPWPMVLGAALVALVLGFVGGMWWIDHRSRKRHGGFRIY